MWVCRPTHVPAASHHDEQGLDSFLGPNCRISAFARLMQEHIHAQLSIMIGPISRDLETVAQQWPSGDGYVFILFFFGVGGDVVI